MSYKGVDFYLVDELFSEDERLIRDAVRKFVSHRLLPVITKHNREATFPVELTPDLAKLGVFGANIQGYGCAGVNNVAYGLMMQELERGDSGLRSFVSVQGALCMYPIHRFGTEEQKQRWLPAMASGKAIGCFGLTEADFGSDPGGLRTRAEKTAGGFRLDGSKYWITNGTLADVAVIWAKLDGVIRGFLVEKGTPGFSSRDIKGKHSLRASVTSELVLDKTPVSEEALLPGTEGLKSALACLNQARYGIAWGVVGAAQAVYDEALHYARERIQFGKAIAAFQLQQAKLADMLTEITKAQLVCERLGRLKDAGKATPAMVSLAKRNNVAMALDAARTAREMLGGVGIMDEYQVFRHMCNLESVKTYEGTHDIHTLILGEAITGLSAFK
ncbi:MAG: acyl-CoA dehydrogenase family protein [Acidobacteriota bacterium]